jgi:hypothetical protein
MVMEIKEIRWRCTEKRGGRGRRWAMEELL